MHRAKFLFIALLLSAIVHAQTVAKDKAVQQTVIKLFDALSNSDTTALKSHCTLDVKFYEYGQIWTIDTLIQKMMLASSAPDFKRTNEFDFVNTAVAGHTAWATYYLQSAITRNGKSEMVKWMETVVLIKNGNQWKIKLLHSTLIKRT